MGRLDSVSTFAVAMIVAVVAAVAGLILAPASGYAALDNSRHHLDRWLSR